MALCLVDLPAEVQNSIYELLDSSDLRSLSLTSRGTHHYSQFALYSQIHLYAPRGRVLHIKLLLRTLLARPELAQCVQHVFLSEWGHNMPMQSSISLPRTDEKYASLELDSELVAEATSWADNLPPASWIERLRRLESTDAEIAFLLSILPRLRSLSLKLNFSSGTKVLGQMLRAAVCQPQQSNSGLHGFQNLRHIFMSDGLSGYRKQRIDSNADILPFFYMPALTSLSMPIPNQSTFDWPSETPNPSSLSTLCLDRVREEHLKSVVSVHTGLKKLVWNCTCVCGYDDLLSNRQVNLDLVGDALTSLSDTLEDFQCNIRIPVLSRSYHAPKLVAQGSLDGLQKMNRLKRLSIPWAFVMGSTPRSVRPMADVLPSSIEHIRFTDDMMIRGDFAWNSCTIYSALKSWAEGAMSSFPNLHAIELAFSGAASDSDETWYHRLKTLKPQAPIKFLISTPHTHAVDGRCDHEIIKLEPKAH